MKWALISVSDKTGIVDFAKYLQHLSYNFLASRGSAKYLEEHGIKATKIEDYIQCEELLNGRVKTLHPYIHAGLLARDKKEDNDTLVKLNIHKIDILICNLYPFESIVKKEDAKEDDVIENIDIGGVSLLRSAAKNYKRVLVASSFDDYKKIMDALSDTGESDIKLREEMAGKAFSLCAHYDILISNWLKTKYQKDNKELPFDDEYISLKTHIPLRYGENPHQASFAYKNPSSFSLGVLDAHLLQGTPLSYNNILDLDLAMRATLPFSYATATIVKHQSPIGIGEVWSEDMAYQAVRYAIKGDPVSAYGGILAFNRCFDKACCHEIEGLFLECIIAPSFSEDAKMILQKRKKCRILELSFPSTTKLKKTSEIRSIIGGYIFQDMDLYCEDDIKDFRCVTKRKIEKEDWNHIYFSWKAIYALRSNAILLSSKMKECTGYYTSGIGSGQPNRVDATKDAIRRGGSDASYSILASDAFIPFIDTLKEAMEQRISIIVQPGGSIRDEECIAYCNEHNLAMVFTGKRHFKH